MSTDLPAHARQLSAARLRAAEQRKRVERRQNRVFLAALIFAFGVLLALGTALGWGIGQAAALVREVWPAGSPPLESNKQAVPAPMDISGPSTACPASSLEVTLVATPDMALRGTPVDFELTITHVGRWPCLVDGGEGNRKVVVVDSEGEVFWNSDHCTEGGSVDLLLGPGDSFIRQLSWASRTSAPGVCTTDQPMVPGGEYFAIGSLPSVAHSDSARVRLYLRWPTPQPPPVFGPTNPQFVPSSPAPQPPLDSDATEPEVSLEAPSDATESEPKPDEPESAPPATKDSAPAEPEPPAEDQ